MEGRDRISEFPADILDTILGFLPIQEAASTAVLSTVWRDAWLSLTQLNFDYDFFCHIEKKYSDPNKTENRKKRKKDSDIWLSKGLDVIQKVLVQHSGPIRKFVFEFLLHNRPSSQSFDLDEWLLRVTENGVEEIGIYLLDDDCRLPICIFSCPTLRRLHLWGGYIDAINSHYILPNITSLCFVNVIIESEGFLLDAPMLNNLSLTICYSVSGLKITAPRLSSLAVMDSRLYCSKFPINLDSESIRTLLLDCYSLEDFVKVFTTRGLQQQPLILNVEYLKLSTDDYDYECGISSAFIHLLRICPKLCKLDIDLLLSDDVPKLLEELPSLAQKHGMLHTLKLNKYKGTEVETLFIKGLLACFSALEKVVIIPKPICKGNGDFENKKEELLHFPCVSTKAKIIFA